jgi:hypothetical protein
MTAAWNSTPVIKTKLKGHNFLKEVKNLIAKKRKLRRKWQQARNPHDKNLLKRVSQQLSETSSNHQLTSSSQNSLQIVALSILFGKLIIFKNTNSLSATHKKRQMKMGL